MENDKDRQKEADDNVIPGIRYSFLRAELTPWTSVVISYQSL